MNRVAEGESFVGGIIVNDLKKSRNHELAFHCVNLVRLPRNPGGKIRFLPADLAG